MFTIICIIGLGFLTILMMVRNEIIYKIRTRKINNIFLTSESNLDELNKPGDYYSMMWQLNKWTYNQFYKS